MWEVFTVRCDLRFVIAVEALVFDQSHATITLNDPAQSSQLFNNSGIPPQLLTGLV